MKVRDIVDAVLKEARKSHDLNTSDLKSFEYVANWYHDRCVALHKNYDLFELDTGKVYGDAMEARIIASFPALTKWTRDTSFDAIAGGTCRVEIKSLRGVRKIEKGTNGNEIFIPLIERIYSKAQGIQASKFATSSFQQTKPSCCDWFLYHIIYGDGDRLFLIPSKMISRHPGKERKEVGKFLLSKQHRAHPDEGQVNLCDVKKYALYFEIDEYDHHNQYDFNKLTKRVEQRLKDINWNLPE